jgi:hypothetical protein
LTLRKTEYEEGLPLYGAEPCRVMVSCQYASLAPAVPAPRGAEQDEPRAETSGSSRIAISRRSTARSLWDFITKARTLRDQVFKSPSLLTTSLRN